MKKRDLAIGLAYLAAGLLFLLTALHTDSPLESLLWGFAGAGLLPGLLMVGKALYWRAPSRAGRYQERLAAQEIDLHDELKDRVRCKAAQYVYGISLVVLSLSIVTFALLDALGVLDNGQVFVFYLCGFFLLQILSGHVMVRRLMKAYQ